MNVLLARSIVGLYLEAIVSSADGLKRTEVVNPLTFEYDMIVIKLSSYSTYQ